MTGAIRPTLRLRLALWFGGVALAAGVLTSLFAWILPNQILSTVIVAAAGAALGYAVTGRALRPLQDVTATARRLSTKNLDERIRLDGPKDEVGELADTFDAMLDRIADSFAAQRRFVANASHELRTPLAVMRTEIDVALSNPDDDVEELRRMGEVVRDGCVRANDLIESLLWLARAEAGGVTETAALPVDLSDCAQAAVDAAAPLADTVGLSLASSLTAAPVLGDRSLLERVAGNLIENAIRHNVPGGRIWVLAGANADFAWMVVGNTGSEIDADSVPRLFEPFSRGGEARVGRRGAGLGLSIVRAVCDAHHGTVNAAALPDGGGLEVRVEIPLAREPRVTVDVRQSAIE
ncbi:sensor histidine kinase [Stackebrandtia soli]|uniref:sensor histidine kinase n=1 Tax=Stackebrandtia soli TaxID=1892856 RepID=UPI0039E9E79C